MKGILELRKPVSLRRARVWLEISLAGRLYLHAFNAPL
jgi:hypothetical protein